MNPALWAAKTGLDAQQTRLAVTSNNLANVSTSGFQDVVGTPSRLKACTEVRFQALGV